MRIVDLWGTQPPAEAHRKVLSDRRRFIVLVAGRKFRKTSISMTRLIKGAMTTSLTYPYILPFRKQAKEVLWYDHIPRILTLFKQNGIPYHKNDSELFIQFPFSGGRFKLDGSDNSEALRGISNWGGFALGEYSDWKADVWPQIIRPNLITTKAWGIFEGTPKGFNQLHRLAKIGDHDNKIEGEIYDENGQVLKREDCLDPEFNTWRFTSYDNPYLDREEIESAKRHSTKAFFAQEYLAQFTKYTGLVYKEFQREVHVIEPFDIPDSWSIYRSFDWGDTNPTVCLWIATDNDENWFILDEHYQPLHGHGYDYLAGIVNANHYSKRSIVASYADPTDPTAITELSLKGIYITPANKETGTNFNSWVRFGIEKVAERLKRVPGKITQAVQQTRNNNELSGGSLEPASQLSGEPGLYVFSGCTNIIREFETYRWKEKSVSQAQDLNEPDVPEKAHDHAMDALRYFAVSYKKSSNEWDNINEGLEKKWRI